MQERGQKQLGFLSVTQIPESFQAEQFPYHHLRMGVYIPLIVVNCIILGRAESYASKNGAVSSFFDGLGMGLGFTLALTILGAFRELLGAGTIFGFTVLPETIFTPITIFILAPGAFFVLSCLVAIKNRIGNRPAKPVKTEETVTEEIEATTAEAEAAGE